MDDVTVLVEEIIDDHLQAEHAPGWCLRCDGAWPCAAVRAADMLEKLACQYEDAVYNRMTRTERVALACRVLAL